MIENWRQATEEEEKFLRREAGWQAVFWALACVCIVPTALLGIWQAYDIYAKFAEGGFSLLFFLVAALCAGVALLAVFFVGSYWKHYREVAGATLWHSQDGRVEKTWTEKSGKSELTYFSFTYRDPDTGEIREEKRIDGKLREGDAISVLACRKESRFEILDVFREGEKKKMDAIWLLPVGGTLIALLLAWAFLHLGFGAASLYIRLCIHLSAIAMSALMLVFGVVERKAGPLAVAVVLAVFMVAFGVPDSLRNIAGDLAEGPREITARGQLTESKTVSRSRRGKRFVRHHYQVQIVSQEADLEGVELTKAAYDYYREHLGPNFTGRVIYYPHTGILLLLE